MTMQLWTVFRRMCGLPGKARVTEIPSETLAMFFLSSHRRGDDVITEQERAEFGHPTPRGMEAHHGA